ncbi:uncharacterized protein LOC129555185 [Moschus berezovskii]|uniref:uncharacterized protein LOC129555185 n=1 Tax=Moschus berezovskii TaxID=68408 RepID=UPI002443AD03|nr:uncharacterized protein LOC129555185 [Moschus berezovskii]
MQVDAVNKTADTPPQVLGCAPRRAIAPRNPAAQPAGVEPGEPGAGRRRGGVGPARQRAAPPPAEGRGPTTSPKRRPLGLRIWLSQVVRSVPLTPPPSLPFLRYRRGRRRRGEPHRAGPEKLARNKERKAPSFAFRRGPSSATRYPLPTSPLCARTHPKARCRLKATTEFLLQTCFEESSSSVCRGICFQFSPRADSAPAGFRITGRGWGLPGTADRERLLKPRALIVQPPSEARPAAFWARGATLRPALGGWGVSTPGNREPFPAGCLRAGFILIQAAHPQSEKLRRF